MLSLRSLLSITMFLSCPLVYTTEITPQSEEKCKQDLTHKVLEQTNLISNYLAHIQERGELASHKDLHDIREAIAHMSELQNISEDMDKEQLIRVLVNNRLRARQLYEVVTSGTITTHKSALPPYIDSESTWYALHDAYEAIQEMIDAAITHFQNYASEYESVYTYITENPLIAASIVSSIAASSTLAYYYWDNEAIARNLNDILEKGMPFSTNIQVKDVLYRGACIAGALTAWVRHRTPQEIENYGPDMIKAWLQAYKQALHYIGLPGSTHKIPVAQTISGDLPDAQEFKKRAKSRGYHVHEERIPGDAIDLKIWQINLLDAALLTAASNCLKNDLKVLFAPSNTDAASQAS